MKDPEDVKTEINQLIQNTNPNLNANLQTNFGSQRQKRAPMLMFHHLCSGKSMMKSLNSNNSKELAIPAQ